MKGRKETVWDPFTIFYFESFAARLVNRIVYDCILSRSHCLRTNL